jgi:hypothetical protein
LFGWKLGLHPETITPTALLGGERFDESGIYGVVEQDFFDRVDGWDRAVLDYLPQCLTLMVLSRL